MNANQVWSAPWCDLCNEAHVGAPCLAEGAALQKISAWNDDCDAADLKSRRRFKNDIGRVDALRYMVKHGRSDLVSEIPA